MTRLVKSIATALTLALVVFLFAACGGDEQATTTAKTSTARASAKTPAGSTNKAENVIGQTIVPTDLTPNDVKRALQSGRPIAILFYMTGPYDDNQVRGSFSSLESKYRGQVDFFNYLTTDAQKYGDLAELLMVNAPPTIVCINKEGQVVRAWTGYVDAESIEQGIVEATK